VEVQSQTKEGTISAPPTTAESGYTNQTSDNEQFAYTLVTTSAFQEKGEE